MHPRILKSGKKNISYTGKPRIQALSPRRRMNRLITGGITESGSLRLTGMMFVFPAVIFMVLLVKYDENMYNI